MELSISEFSMQDYADAVALWRATEGVGLSSADEPGRIAAYLARNPGMSFIAREEGSLVGAVLAGHDGRRGYLHHLVVRTDRRGLGIGRQLVEHSMAALRGAGIDKCHLFVFRTNASGVEFWRKVGWKERGDLILMSKST